MPRSDRFFVAFAAALPCALAATAARAQEPAAERPPIVLKSVAVSGLTFHYQNIPWGPQTFAAMESPGDSFYNKRTWPFARLESEVAVTIEGTRLAPGNYALVFHPASAAHPGMSLEVLKVEPGEFQQAGNVMARAPQGESVFKGPVTFARAAETVPALDLTLARSGDGLALEVAYGDRRLTLALRL